MPAFAADLRASVTLLALLGLPGLCAVRACFRLVPFVSLAFWILSWRWLPTLERPRLVPAALVGLMLLAALRLLKPVSRPRAPEVVALLLAAAPLLSLGLWPTPEGPESSPQLATVQVAVWHRDWPLSYEPLLPDLAFGARPPGLPLVAADVALVSGSGVRQAWRAVCLASFGLLLLALDELLRLRFAGMPAQLGATGAWALASIAAVGSWGLAAGQACLGLGFGLAAVGLLSARKGAASAAAAGLIAAAAGVVEPTVLPAVALAGGLFGVRLDRRFGLAAGLAASAMAPFLPPLATALRFDPRVPLAGGVLLGLAWALAAGATRIGSKPPQTHAFTPAPGNSRPGHP